MSEYNFSKDLEKLSKVKKFNKEQQLDGIQHDPNKMKSTIFKQDYVVIIRKKLYYAISQEDEDDAYDTDVPINTWRYMSGLTFTSVY